MFRKHRGETIIMAGRLLVLLACLLSTFLTALAESPSKVRRVLYNLDGDSCMTLKAGRKGPGPVSIDDLRRIPAELRLPGSQVDTLLLCINAQVTYFPSREGTMRGESSTPEERARWSPGESQRFQNLKNFFDSGTDPYAVILKAAREQGMEALISIRMNDDHGDDFLRTKFWEQNPEARLGKGALDFGQAAVRDYIVRIIGEALERYDCDGVELDFQRFPSFFKQGAETDTARLTKLNEIVRRVRDLADLKGKRIGKRLIVAARAPSNYGRQPPSPEASRAIGCDPAEWARQGWIDFLTISDFLFVRYDLAIRPWKKLIPQIPIYGGIECTEGSGLEQCMTPARYRRAARHLWQDGADGIYLFNFFTTREHGADAFEPPFEVLSQIGSVATLEKFPPAPWETNRPIAAVKKSLHAKSPGPQTAVMATMTYVGPGLERREWSAIERVSDVHDEQRARWTTDNGATWTDWISQQPSSIRKYGTKDVWEGGWADIYDPASDRLVQLWLRQIEIRGVFHNAAYIRTSADRGRTWASPHALRYETGPDFDPDIPAREEFLQKNNGYPGNNLCLRKDGSFAFCLAHANAPGDAENHRRPWRMGSVMFTGRWNSREQAYEWAPGARTEIAPSKSARGLMEPEVAELKDGRLLVVWRGSDEGWDGSKASEPGRKWHSISGDGGLTLSEVKPWTWSDGSPFYSSSSIHRMIRHSQTGKLYWIGNISMEPPKGNMPRFPLILVEVDETHAAPVRETAMAIDDRLAHQGLEIQFSNFSLLEDRTSGVLELYLTTYGQEWSPKDWATADCFSYKVELKQP
ncbi:MAG: hypothetical protein FJ405_05625 [Verrucomicrobia bacterium]|nr:hypothetical protein [Verrucomicrobiota bacterium]